MRTLLLAVCVLFPFTASAQDRRAADELHDISEVMESARRAIRRTNTGPETQERQKDAIARLQEMIDRLEEQQSRGGAGAGGAARQPASSSGVPEAAARTGTRRRRPPTATQKWGGVKPGVRAAIEAELHMKMPVRYRKMLDRYFARLAKSGR